MFHQAVHHHFTVAEFGDGAAAVDQDDVFVAFVGVRVFDDADEGCEAGAGAEQVQGFAGVQIVLDERAGGFAADQEFIADDDLLQMRGQRASGDLDGEELQMFLVVGVAHGVGAQQWPAVYFQADHGELPADEAEAGVTRGGEAEKRVGPVPDGQHRLGIHRRQYAAPRESLPVIRRDGRKC